MDGHGHKIEQIQDRNKAHEERGDFGEALAGVLTLLRNYLRRIIKFSLLGIDFSALLRF